MKFVSPSQELLDLTGAIFDEGGCYVSLCRELDVASQGCTVREAKKKLGEAVELYLETCFENDFPYLRQVPRQDDPRFSPPDNFVVTFPLRVDFRVHAMA